MNNPDKELLESITTNSDLYYISLILLSAFNKRGYKQIPELALILDEDNLMRLLDVYGGQTIQIPTKEQLGRYLKAISVYYYTEIKGMGMSAAMSKAHATGDNGVRVDMHKMKKFLSTLKLPDRKIVNDK
jgi:hypothetical protein